MRIIGSKIGSKNAATRESWLEQALQQVPAGSKILDAGAGEQPFKRFCAHLDYIAQDLAEYDGKGDGVGLQMESWDVSKLNIVSDITDIPAPDESFDAIMCTEVFEHLPDPLLAIKEFARLLRVGGLLIITAPFCSLTHFAPYHYSTGFNRYYYEHHLPMYGFEIVEFAPNGNFFEFVAQEVRRVPQMAETYAQRKPRIYESLAMWVALQLLGRLNRTDSGSDEMLHFGCHLRAIKTLNTDVPTDE